MYNKFSYLFIVINFLGFFSKACVATRSDFCDYELVHRKNRVSESIPLLQQDISISYRLIKSTYYSEVINDYNSFCKANKINSSFDKILKDFETIPNKGDIFKKNARVYKNHLKGQYCVPNHLINPFYDELVRIITERKTDKN